MGISENQLDNLVHTIVNHLAGYGITLDSDLACDLNDVLSDFITEKCDIEVSQSCAGMGVMEPASLEGVETAYQSLGNHCDDDSLCSTVEALKNSATLNELSSSAVDNMGDIFWDAAEYGETDTLPEDIARDCVKEAIISALDKVLIDFAFKS